MKFAALVKAKLYGSSELKMFAEDSVSIKTLTCKIPSQMVHGESPE